MTIVRETTITIDRQREITVAVHDEGAVTLSLEDPGTVAIVEIPAGQLAELHAAIGAALNIDDAGVRLLLDGLEVKTIAELKTLVDAGHAALDDTLDEASWRRASLPTLRDVHPLELLDEPDGVLESMAAGDLDVTDKTKHLAQAELDYRRAQAQR